MKLYNKIVFALATVILLSLNLCYAVTKKGVSTDKLTCEYIVNPLGIEVLKPRLSWTLLSSQRNQRQTAYELIVSDNIKEIIRRKGNTWTTGKVTSSQSLHVV